MALMLLSILLNDIEYWDNIFEKSINNLFYVDDLKIFAKIYQQLQGLLTTVKQFNDDIGTDFGLDKYAKAIFIKGKKLGKHTTLLSTKRMS